MNFLSEWDFFEKDCFCLDFFIFHKSEISLESDRFCLEFFDFSWEWDFFGEQLFLSRFLDFLFEWDFLGKWLFLSRFLDFSWDWDSFGERLFLSRFLDDMCRVLVIWVEPVAPGVYVTVLIASTRPSVECGQKTSARCHSRATPGQNKNAATHTGMPMFLYSQKYLTVDTRQIFTLETDWPQCTHEIQKTSSQRFVGVHLYNIALHFVDF